MDKENDKSINSNTSKKTTITGILQVVLLLSSIFTIGGYFSKYVWYFDLFSHFRVHYFAFFLIMSILCLILKRRKLFLFSLILCLSNLAHIIPLYIPYGTFNSEITNDSMEIKIVHLNVLTSNQDYQSTIKYIEDKKPDIVALNEVNQSWIDNLELSKEYKYSVEEIREDNFGIAIYSKIELNNPRIEYFGDADVPSAAAEFYAGDKEISILATHPFPPANKNGVKLRNNQFDSIVQNRKGFKESMILLGDLNTTSWSHGFQSLVRGMDLYDSRRGYGIGFSWSTTLPIISVPIDHCLVSKEIKVLKREIGPNLGSDHRPIFVELSIPKTLAAENRTDKTIERDNKSTPLPEETHKEDLQKIIINPEGSTIQDRFNVPEGFERVPVNEGSFEEYLRTLPLKPHGSFVHYFDGRVKMKDVYDAVIDIDVGDRDLQQCADAVMRLRAEYLYNKGFYDKIHFNFTNGFKADYFTWRNGNRIVVEGNKSYWVKRAEYSEDYAVFRQYMDMVFAYAGTLSLSMELDKVNIEDMKIGDIFMKGALPGHCVIIVDMAENKSTGEKLFMIAQSYMPAQDIQVLKNNADSMKSPWYSSDFGEQLNTPEWTFNKEQLMRFRE